MTKEHEKIIKWLIHGVDDRFLLLEMAKQTNCTDFYNTVRMLVDLQTNIDTLQDNDNKMCRLSAKAEALEGKIKTSNTEQAQLIEDMYKAMMETIEKLLKVGCENESKAS